MTIPMDWHQASGMILASLQDELLSHLVTASALRPRQAALVIHIRHAERHLERLRSELEEAMFSEYPSTLLADVTVYYPTTPIRRRAS